MADKDEKQPAEAKETDTVDEPIVVTTGAAVPPPDPLEGAHKDSKGVWVNKDGQPLGIADATLAEQRLTAKGEPRKQ